MNRAAWIVLASVTVLTGCAHMGKGITPEAAPDAVIWVEDGKIQVVPQTIFVDADKKNVRLVWEIRDVTSYRFGAETSDKPGIVIKMPDGEFTDCKIHPHGKRFSCHNRHTKKARYKYDINLVSQFGLPPLFLDPVIYND